MFPEIVRDEVFRLETRRLWLRWPTLADAFDAANAAVLEAAVGNDIRLPGMACIAAWRAATETGEALHLMLEAKGSRSVIGSLHLIAAADRQACLRYRLSPAHRGLGLMTEAVQAAADMTFLLDAAETIVASPSAEDMRGRGVLERCGFTRVDAGPWISTKSRHPAARDHFRLDRPSGMALDGTRRSGTTDARLTPLRPAACLPVSL